MATTTATTRPAWRHKTPEEFARWMHNNPIVKITHDWTMTGVDTSDYWLTLHPKTGNPRRAPPLPPSFSANGEVEFRPNHNGLISLRADVSSDLFKIIEWEQAHAGKLQQFNELKKELGL